MGEHLAEYLLTWAFVLALALLGWRRARTCISFGVFFPVWYALYSFIGPMPFLLGERWHSFSNSYLVWDKMYPLKDGEAIWTAHVVYVGFLAAWAAGYFLDGKWRSTTFTHRHRTGAQAGLAATPVMWVFLATISLALAVSGMLFAKVSGYGGGYTSIYAAKVALGPQHALTTTFKGVFSLWGAALVCLSVAVVWRGPSRWISPWVAATLLSWAWFAIAGFVTGDRSQTFSFLIAGACVAGIACVRSRRTAWRWGLAFLVVLLLSNSLTKRYRGDIPEAKDAVETITDYQYLIGSSLGSVEFFAAYAALPILIDIDAPPSGGTSVLAMAESIVPRFMTDSRSLGSRSYRDYSQLAGFADSGQGFTMHFVADLYMNFGGWLALMGGALVGAAMSAIEWRAMERNSPFWLAAWAVLMGAIPAHLRGGIEGLRAVIYEYWLIPFVVFVALPFISRAVAQRNRQVRAVA